MWLRQEYKPEKARFQKPFELEVNTDVVTQTNKRPTQEQCKEMTIRLEQSYAALGTTVWDGSIVLAKMFDNRTKFPLNYLQNSRVIELGAGCGLVGIYLSLLRAKMTVLTDQNCCIKTLEHNVEMNVPANIRNRIKVAEYSWGDSPSALCVEGCFDLILAAEVLYSPADSELLARCIPRMSHSSSRIYISVGRNRGGEEQFVQTIASQGYSCREVP